ncbi:MAG: FIST N-terminal domain-containing protein [Bacteroidota bacterium]
MLQFYSASTSIVNSKRAITECLEIALEGEPTLDCDLIIIYTAMGHNFKELLSEAHSLSPNARIVGCTGAGIIGREGPNETLKALAIMAIKGPKKEFAVACSKYIENMDTFEKGVTIAQGLKRQNPDINMILFLPSVLPMSPLDKAIAGIESVFNPNTPIFGGSSVDNMKGINTYTLFDDQVFEKGWIAIGFADPTLKIITQVNHGFNILQGMQLEVTRSESNIIYEFNGQPAWKFLTNMLGVPETTDPLEVMTLGIGAEEIPAELKEEYGSRYVLRSLFGNVKENSFYFPSACKEGTRLFLAKRDEKGMFDGVDRMAKRIQELLKGKKPLAIFHADCLLRGRFSINRILKDEIINRMQHPICQGDPLPWLGLYSGGEFAMIGGKNWVHTFTSALSVIHR